MVETVELRRGSREERGGGGERYLDRKGGSKKGEKKDEMDAFYFKIKVI